MNTPKAIILLQLACATWTFAQTDITVEILDSIDTNEMAMLIQAAQSNRYDSAGEYVSCLTYLNPRNHTNIMAQWTVIESLFETNNIRIGLTMCSLGCGSSIHIDDIERAKTILDKAIAEKLIDNNVLKMKIEAQQGSEGTSSRGRAESPHR